MRGEVAIGPSIYGVYVIDGSLCSRVYGMCVNALSLASVASCANPTSFLLSDAAQLEQENMDGWTATFGLQRSQCSQRQCYQGLKSAYVSTPT